MLAEIDNTFEKVAQNWFEYRKTRANFSAKYAKDTWCLIERNLFIALWTPTNYSGNRSTHFESLQAFASKWCT